MKKRILILTVAICACAISGCNFKKAENSKANNKEKQEQTIDNAGKQALYKLACEKGYTISEKELDKLVDEARDGMNGTEEAKILEDYIKKNGMTEEEYWDTVREKYKMYNVIDKLKMDYEAEQLLEKKINPDDYEKAIEKIDEELVKIAKEKYGDKAE